MAMPWATVVSSEQVSGQSCGQAPSTWVAWGSVVWEEVWFIGRDRSNRALEYLRTVIAKLDYGGILGSR